MTVFAPITATSAHHHPPSWISTHSTLTLATNPASGGSPTRLNMNAAIAAASTGDRRPSPAYAAIDSLPVSRHTSPATVNAPRFMNTYTARYSKIACAAAADGSSNSARAYRPTYITDTAQRMYPACAIELYASSRLILYCTKAAVFPTVQ